MKYPIEEFPFAVLWQKGQGAAALIKENDGGMPVVLEDSPDSLKARKVRDLIKGLHPGMDVTNILILDRRPGQVRLMVPCDGCGSFHYQPSEHGTSGRFLLFCGKEREEEESPDLLEDRRGVYDSIPEAFQEALKEAPPWHNCLDVHDLALIGQDHWTPWKPSLFSSPSDRVITLEEV